MGTCIPLHPRPLTAHKRTRSMDAFYITIGDSDVPLSYFDEDPAKLKAVKKVTEGFGWC